MSTLALAQETAPAATLASLRDEIERTNRSYHSLPRSQGQAWPLVAAKVEYAHWRKTMVDRLLVTAERTGSRQPVEATLTDALIDLSIFLNADERARLRSLVSETAFAKVLASQGTRLAQQPAFHNIAGPDLDLKIEVNRDSPWPFQRWSNNLAFTDYEFEGDGVRYRNLLLRPGDVILPNVNLDGNFVYTALSDPKGFCPHSAVFTILERDGRRFPSVIETYEKGLRAVPLCLFLNARFISYAEVFRHRDLDTATAARITPIATEALGEAVGYNFLTRDEDRRYVCCTNVSLQLLERAGLAPIEHFSALVDPGVQRNMRALGYEHLDLFFTPIDFVLSEQFTLVGVVDNGQPARLLTRELIERRFRQCFSERELTLEQLPLMVKLIHFAIGHARRQSPLGRLFSALRGLDDVTLPKGPDWVLAIIGPLEEELSAAVRKLLPVVEEKLRGVETLTLQAWLEDSALEQRVRKILPMRWLTERP